MQYYITQKYNDQQLLAHQLTATSYSSSVKSLSTQPNNEHSIADV